MDTAQSKSEHTFTAIVGTALALAAAEGIGNLSLGEVAKQLGISKSGVFSRVGSLEALQQAVLDEFDRRFAAAVFTPALVLPRGLARLNAIVEHWIRYACLSGTASACLYTAGAFEYDDVESRLRERLLEGVLRWRAGLRRTVQQALDAGHLRPDTDPEQLVFEIYSLIVGLMHDARFLRDASVQTRVRGAYARLISTYRRFDYLG